MLSVVLNEPLSKLAVSDNVCLLSEIARIC